MLEQIQPGWLNQQTRVCKARDGATNAHWAVGSLVFVYACIFRQTHHDNVLDQDMHAACDLAQHDETLQCQVSEPLYNHR